MAAADEAILKRVLPHSIEAEQSVIGSMIMDREAIVVASEIITGEDFYNRQYGVLFETMVELNDSGRPVDLVTLQDKLREKDVPPTTEIIRRPARCDKQRILTFAFYCRGNLKKLFNYIVRITIGIFKTHNMNYFG